MNPVSFITSNDVTEYEIYKFGVDASQLNWTPGYFPISINTNLGNGMSFIRTDVLDYAVKYRQQSGCIELTVFND